MARKCLISRILKRQFVSLFPVFLLQELTYLNLHSLKNAESLVQCVEVVVDRVQDELTSKVSPSLPPLHSLLILYASSRLSVRLVDFVLTFALAPISL